jgi:Fe-S-cluster-containing dehydrogenase component/formate-dependent nitrite reductase membrane component NrfD
MAEGVAAAPGVPPARWGKVIDHVRCIGCHACSTACKSENRVPLSVNRTYVKYVDVGTFPQARRAFQVTRCNQCEQPPCAHICPTGAMHQRADGIVDFDKVVCIGCKACIAACPYDAIFINPADHSAEKCNFCAHRIDMGLEPACVVVCPSEAILVGDLNDAASGVAHLVARTPTTVRRPEKGTRPKLFYRGAHQATLDPLAAQPPAGGQLMWSEQGSVPHQLPPGAPGPANGAAPAVLAYDVPHRMPWDWRVSLYTWTKGIAAGAYLVPAMLILLGILAEESALWRWATPIMAGAFLAATGLVLIADLDHPERVTLLATRPRWNSWLARGGVIISLFGLVLALHFAGSSLAAGAGVARLLLWPGAVLAGLTAIYTAYLLAQARARDLWQNPLLVPQLLVQAVMAGSALLLVAAPWVDPGASAPLAAATAGAALVHLLLVAGETTLAHPTAHAALAARTMVAGRYAPVFWSGVVLMAAGVLAPWIGAAAAVPALAGLLAYEHAYVQSGQSVPLA